MEAARRRKARMLALLAGIWFVAALPLPWLVGNPDVADSSLHTILGIVAVISAPFVALGIAWTLRPELTT